MLMIVFGLSTWRSVGRHSVTRFRMRCQQIRNNSKPANAIILLLNLQRVREPIRNNNCRFIPSCLWLGIIVGTALPETLGVPPNAYENRVNNQNTMEGVNS